jgi:hypothetical protein
MNKRELLDAMESAPDDAELFYDDGEEEWEISDVEIAADGSIILCSPDDDEAVDVEAEDVEVEPV